MVQAAASHTLPFVLLSVAVIVLFSFCRPPFLHNALSRLNLFLFATGFSKNEILAHEIRRFEIARIATGAILFHRTLYTAIYLPPEATEITFVVGYATLALAAFLAVGFLTPPSALIILLFAHPADYALHTVTLGTDVLQMIMLALTFAPVGQVYSLDSVLARRFRLWRIYVDGLNRLIGPPTIERLSILRFLALLSYSFVCIYSVLAHVGDPAWMEGFANAQILTSSYLSRHYDWFREVFAACPDIGLRLAQATTFLMMVWEALLLPMVFLSRLTRRIAVVWGLLFFVVSGFLLQLGWLPHYEFALWTLLFWQTSWPVRHPHSAVDHPRIQPGLDKTLAIVCGIYSVLLLAFVAQMPVISTLPLVSNLRDAARVSIKNSSELLGLAAINVFNEHDLRLSEGYYTIETQDQNGQWHLLPYTGSQGERLAWHFSDRIYYGNSLWVRRSRIGKSKECFEEWHTVPIGEIVSVAQAAQISSKFYRVRYYYQALPDSKQIKRYEFKMPEINLVCEVLFDASTRKFHR